jgi:hypothetical protein
MPSAEFGFGLGLTLSFVYLKGKLNNITNANTSPFTVAL